MAGDPTLVQSAKTTTAIAKPAGVGGSITLFRIVALVRRFVKKKRAKNPPSPEDESQATQVTPANDRLPPEMAQTSGHTTVLPMALTSAVPSSRQPGSLRLPRPSSASLGQREQNRAHLRNLADSRGFPAGAPTNDTRAQLMVDEIWDLLGHQSATSGVDEDRKKLLHLCLDLANNFNTLPAPLFLTDVRYREPDLVGKGGCAEVLRGKQGDSVVAVKRIRENVTASVGSRINLTKTLNRQALVWRSCRHSHVLPLLGVLNENGGLGSMSLVMPFMENGSIRDYVKSLQAQGKLEESGRDFVAVVTNWLHQISLGLDYIHAMSLTHRGLHCGNILIDSDGDARVTDIGVTVIVDAHGTYDFASMDGTGAILYRAPELLRPSAVAKQVKKACDMYSFAFVCVELYSGQRPFPGVSEFDAVGLVARGKRPTRPLALKDVPGGSIIWSLINLCWEENPAKRPKSLVVSQQVGLVNQLILGNAGLDR